MRYSRWLLIIFSFFFLQLNFINTTEIAEACKRGDLTTVKHLLESNPSLLYTTNDFGEGLLHFAAWGGNVDLIDFLVSKGLNVDQKTQGEWTPLLYAVNFRKENAALALLNKGAKTGIQNVWGQTPLLFASGAGMEAVVQKIIKTGANLNIKDDTGQAPLHRAAERGKVNIIDLLLKNGADIHIRDNGGETPLIKAAMSGGHNSFKFLIKKGARLSDRDVFGRTLLHRAAIAGDFELVKNLLQENKIGCLKDSRGWIAYKYAHYHGHLDLVALFRSQGSYKHHPTGFLSTEKLLKDPLKKGEAIIWYLTHCGWVIRTASAVLIFDYINPGKNPKYPGLANGRINPRELAGHRIYVFVTHAHGDHYNKDIFAWKEHIPHIRYILGWEEKVSHPYLSFQGEEVKKIDNITITTIKAYHGDDGGVGFAITLDGLTIYHSGDHFNPGDQLEPGFTDKIDYLAGRLSKIDLAFIDGPHKLKDQGVIYTLNKLSPRVFFPMHAGNKEYMYHNLIERIKEDLVSTIPMAVQNRGDRFLYKNGKLFLLN